MDKINVNISLSEMPFNVNNVSNNKAFYLDKDIKKNEKENQDYELDISSLGKNKAEKSDCYKRSGVSSAREAWEDSAQQLKSQKRITGRDRDLLEAMRYEEPETYQKWLDSRSKYMDTLTHNNNGLITYTLTHSYDDIPDEGKEYLDESSRILSAFSKRYNRNINYAKKIENTISQLDSQFSDDLHDVIFNMYGGNNPNAESIWRFNSKFSVMISKSMLDTITDNDSKKYGDLISFIDNSVKNMKQAELDYEGNLEWLRFGVKLYDDGSVTYHANFIGCKESSGIQANSSDDLLQLLTNYKIKQ